MLFFAVWAVFEGKMLDFWVWPRFFRENNPLCWVICDFFAKITHYAGVYGKKVFRTVLTVKRPVGELPGVSRGV